MSRSDVDSGSTDLENGDHADTSWSAYSYAYENWNISLRILLALTVSSLRADTVGAYSGGNLSIKSESAE